MKCIGHEMDTIEMDRTLQRYLIISYLKHMTYNLGNIFFDLKISFKEMSSLNCPIYMKCPIYMNCPIYMKCPIF